MAESTSAPEQEVEQVDASQPETIAVAPANTEETAQLEEQTQPSQA